MRRWLFGAHTSGASRSAALALAILAPLLAAVAWGLFVSPKAKIRAPKRVRLGVELAIFLAAAGGLAAAGETDSAIAFSAAVVVHELWRLAQRTRDSR